MIKRNILSTDPDKKIKLIYYNKFKTSNLVINNNSSPSIGVLQKTNVVYQFKCTLGDCTPENNSIYVGLTSKYPKWSIQNQLCGQVYSSLMHLIKQPKMCIVHPTVLFLPFL